MSASPIKPPFFHKFCPFLLATLLASSLTALIVSSPSFATQAAISESELVTILRTTKVVPADSKLSASISGDEVVVTTTKKEGATNDASKIQAVLIAKTVFDSVSNDAQRTKVIFFDFSANTYSEVAVKRAEVKMYGSGQLTEKELLSSLELKRGDGDSAEDETVKVAAGPLQPDRIILSARLLKLENEGSGVKDLRQLFEQLEATAKSGDQIQTKVLCRNLSALVQERENALYEARHLKNLTSLTGKERRFNDHKDQPADDKSSSLSKFLVGPKGEKIYKFSSKDLPKVTDKGYIQVRGYLKLIRENTANGRNMQVPITLMNTAIQSFAAGDDDKYHSCLGELFKQLGSPILDLLKGAKH